MTSKTQFSSQCEVQTRQIKHCNGVSVAMADTHTQQRRVSQPNLLHVTLPCLPFKRDTDRITRSNRTHLQQTLTTQNLQITSCYCRQATYKRPDCLTNMIGGRRTLQTYITTIKHDYLLCEDSIVSLSRRENTMTTD